MILNIVELKNNNTPMIAKVIETFFQENFNKKTDKIIATFKNDRIRKFSNRYGTYGLKRINSRRYFYSDDMYDAEKIEIVKNTKANKNSEFATYEEFKKEFDLRFISEEQIKKLYSEESCQTGQRYKRSDFKTISAKGRRVVKDFLRKFKNINEPTLSYTPSYYKDADYKVLSVKEYANGNRGNARDISISHQTNIPMVFYSSEFAGCGNGSYYILVKENKILHLEDD